MPNNASPSNAQPVATWELGRDSLADLRTAGCVEYRDGGVRLDGTNSFSLPPTVLGDQRDYTISLRLTRQATGQEDLDSVPVIGNMDAEAGCGFALGPCYYPPCWRSTQLAINGFKVISQRAMEPGVSYQLTLVSQGGQLLFFMDGLLLGMTDRVKPSERPLTVGRATAEPVVPYVVSELTVHDHTVFPSSYDASVEMMRSYSGDQYAMLRADVHDPALPRILVIGDSISMGYRRYITEHFAGHAYVDYWVCPLMFKLTPADLAAADGLPAPILRAWTGVLANGPYDVISWNHATLHMWDPAKPERCSPDSYPDCMRRILRHVQDTAPDSQLLWVRCTPIVTTDGDAGPSLNSPQNARIVLFNDATDALMAEQGIPLVDLYAICAAHLDRVTSDGIHWEADAYQLMAQAIIDATTFHLAQRGQPDTPTSA